MGFLTWNAWSLTRDRRGYPGWFSGGTLLKIVMMMVLYTFLNIMNACMYVPYLHLTIIIQQSIGCGHWQINKPKYSSPSCMNIWGIHSNTWFPIQFAHLCFASSRIEYSTSIIQSQICAQMSQRRNCCPLVCWLANSQREASSDSILLAWTTYLNTPSTKYG